MTEVSFILNADHKFVGFECSGHAGFARFNKPDVVCAGISVLSINAINSLEEIAKAKTDVRTEQKTGFMYCRLKSVPTAETEVLFKSLELGIKGISQSYGSKYCKVTYKED